MREITIDGDLRVVAVAVKIKSMRLEDSCKFLYIY